MPIGAIKGTKFNRGERGFVYVAIVVIDYIREYEIPISADLFRQIFEHYESTNGRYSMWLYVDEYKIRPV